MDITGDRIHSTLLHVCKQGLAPDYVLDSKPMDKEAADKLPSSLFADRANRRYPVDSKANTWLSAAYFAKTAEDDGYSSRTMKDLVEATIKKAADKYGIRKDVDSVMEALSPKTVKQAEDESCYGYPQEKKYPMFDEHGVKMANSYFEDNRFHYPPEMRREIATRIMAKCAEYGIKPCDAVRIESGNGFALREDAGVELLDRVKMASHDNPEVAGHLADAVSTMMSIPMPAYQANLAKFASILDAFDSEMGFDDGYGVRFHSPMEIFHSRDPREASDFMNDSIMLGPSMFSISKLAGLPMSVFTDALGDDFGGKVKVIRITAKGSPKPCGNESCDTEEDADFELMDDPFESKEDDSDKSEKSDKRGKSEKEEEDEIDPKKLGDTLRVLPDEDRDSLYRSITIYMG